MEEEESVTEVTEITDGTSSSFLQEPKRKINFYPEVELCEIPNRWDMSDEEYFLCFYSPDEIDWMNEEQNETADRIESGEEAKRDTPYRGLEAWTQEGQYLMNQRIFSCVDAVLDEQDKQWKKNKSSTRKIARASKSLSKSSNKLALELAKQDEIEARKIYEEDLNDEHDDYDHDEQDNEEETHIPLRAVIQNSTFMKSKRGKSKNPNGPSSVRSLDGSFASIEQIGMSMHSRDSFDSGFWSLTSSSNSVLDKPKKKKRKSKKKSAARDGLTPNEDPKKTPASRRKKIKKKKQNSTTDEPKIKKVGSKEKIKKVSTKEKIKKVSTNSATTKNVIAG